MLAAFGAESTEGDAAMLVAKYRGEDLSSRREVFGASRLLESLRKQGLLLGVVSNNVLSEQLEKLELLGMRESFDALAISEEVGATKPDPEIFRVALERIGCHAREVVMIGDSWSSDIEGAANAGIRSIWLNRTGAPCPDARLAAEVRCLSEVGL
jgi:putative hydrolase of the HAD superfamily